MAEAAGLQVSRGKVITGINDREVLLLERFDRASEDRRHHLLTINGMLKEPGTQRNVGQAFRYDMVAELVKSYVQDVENSLEQLVRVMIFNAAINNTDDHERNFSFINRRGQYELSPAYDLVPSLDTGAYHAAAFNYSVGPPGPSRARKLRKIFGVPRPTVASIADEVEGAVSHWREHAEDAGVSEQEADRISTVFKL